MKKRFSSQCHYSNGFFVGWAYDPFVLNLEVSLFEDKKLISESIANLDLKSQNLVEIEQAPNENCAFSLRVPSYLLDGKNHKLSVKVTNWTLVNDPKPISINFCYGNVSGMVVFDDGIYSAEISFAAPLKELPDVFIYEDVAASALEKIELIPLDISDNGCTKAIFEYKNDKELYFKCNNIILENNSKKRESQIVGKVFDITKDAISGFIIDVANLDKTLGAYLYIDSLPICMITPMQKSESIAKQLKIDYELLNNCFFKISTPEILLDGKTHKVEIICRENSKVIDGGSREIAFSTGAISYDRVVKRLAQDMKAAQPLSKDNYDLSIIILNRNGEDILKELFESFIMFNTSNAEFIIIDHASTDESLSMIQDFSSKLPIKVKALGYNDSFSASCNLGASMATSDTLLFLNNDIIWVQDILPQMLQSLEDDSVGFVGLKLIKKDAGWISEVQHLGVRFTLVANEYFPYEVMPTSTEVQNEYSPTILPAITGAVMLCRKSDFDKIGGFDSNYFYGFEDVEICIRMKNLLGKSSLCRNDLVALHKHGYTRLSGREKSVLNKQEHNTKVLFETLGLWLKQKAREALFMGDREWSLHTLNIAFVVTDRIILNERENSAIFVPLAQAIKQHLPHVKLFFLSPDYDWYDVKDIDMLIVSDKNYDLRLLKNEKASITRILYLKEEKELASFKSLPWHSKYDILASEQHTNVAKLLDLASTQLRVAILVPSYKKDFEESDYRSIADMLCYELRELGVKVVLLPIEEWDKAPMVVDTYIQLYDVFCKKYHLTIRRAAVNVLWVLDDVNSVDSDLSSKYDVVYSLEQSNKNGYAPKIINTELPTVDMKRYIMLDSFDKLPPVVYPHTYYVSEGLTYPLDDVAYAKRVEIYVAKGLKRIYKPWVCKTKKNAIYVGEFTSINDILQNKTTLKRWKEPKEYNAENFIDSIKNIIKEKCGHTLYSS